MRFGSLALGLCSALALVLFSSLPAFSQFSNSVMPGPGWQVVRAQWGSGNRWMDVTPRVRVLLSGNGMVQVNNQNMGGDPAVGASKSLVIEARTFQGQTRRFTFREGGAIDASQFYNYGGGFAGNSGPGWLVTFADWGSGNRRVVVTDRVRSMLSGSGMVRVNNQNLGGDPAVGASKTLRISARDARGQVRQFSYREGASIDARQFANYGGIPGGGFPGPAPGFGNLQIVRAFYGLNNRTNDVSQLLRSQIRNNTLVLQVNNRNLGGDPAPGADKVLTVIYRLDGREQSATVKEGNTLRIP
ncbi:MAG TPA: hypothetical protein VF749_04610 [Candidatus Acidoferrum sp.]